MDNPFFPLHHKHLRGCKPCAPNPVGAVTPAGTKRAHRLFLWISQHLCQKYPQFYAAPRRQRLFSAKTQASALPASAISSFFNSKTAHCRKKRGAPARVCPGSCGQAHPMCRPVHPFFYTPHTALPLFRYSQPCPVCLPAVDRLFFKSFILK